MVAGGSADSVQITELSPAEVVAFRFPASGAAPPPAIDRVDSAAPTGRISGGAGNYRLQSASPLFVPFPISSSQPDRPRTDRSDLPEQTLAYADVESGDRMAPTTAAIRLPDARPQSSGSVKRAAPSPRPASRNSALLNNAQIASIRDRLNLSSYQEQYWPPVEAALREIGYHQKSAHQSDSRSPSIDVTSGEVQRLKSAAVPLIMSMREEQKEEVRKLARLMGLENLAAQF
jgi:hypothetical protein